MKLSLQGMPLAGAAAAFLFGVCAAAHADDRTLIELKAKLFDARVAVKTFAMGLPFCKELNGTNFFYEPRRRVLNLADYHESLQHMVHDNAYNREKREPWNAKDAETRWEQVKRKAAYDQATCRLAAALPDLERQVREIEAKSGPTAQAK